VRPLPRFTVRSEGARRGTSVVLVVSELETAQEQVRWRLVRSELEINGWHVRAVHVRRRRKVTVTMVQRMSPDNKD
jgi:hypothetical protein